MPNSPTRKGSVFIKPPVKLLATGILLSFVVFAACSRCRPEPDTDRGTALLVEAFCKRRLIEPRLSGGFKCGNFRAAPDDASDINTSKLDEARGLILDSVDDSKPTSQLAYARLLLSKGEKLPDAFKYLQRVLAASPDNAEAHNDLGVCLTQQGKIEDAIEQFEAALKLNAGLSEAVFNRALCYGRLLLKEAATAEYDRLLAIENDAGWIEEIKTRRQEISGQPPSQVSDADMVAPLDAAVERRDLAEARRIAGEQLEPMIGAGTFHLPIRYLTEASTGETERAERTMSEIELIGELVDGSMGDSSVIDLASYLRNLPATEREAELKLIKDYDDAATNVFANRDYVQGVTRFAKLNSQFKERANSVFECLSINDFASCLSSSGAAAASLDTLRNAIAQFEKRRWPFRQGMLLMSLGLTHSQLGEDSNAIDDLTKALEISRSAPRCRAKAKQLIGLAHRHLGDLEKGLDCLKESNQLFLTCRLESSELAYNYLSSSEFQRLRGNHQLALLFSQEGMRFCKLSESPSRTAQLLSSLAIEHARLGQFEQAQTLLASAFDQVEQTKEPQRFYTKQLVLTRAADLAVRRGDVADAIKLYSEAEVLLEKIEGRELSKIDVYRGRAEAYFLAKEFEKARVDLDQAIALIEKYRLHIKDPNDRSAYLDASHSVFDQMILLNVRGFGRWPEAFDFSEQSRARTLLDSFSRESSTQGSATRESGPRGAKDNADSRPAARLKLADLRRALPPNLTLLTYSVTEKGTIVFIITSSGLQVVELTATAELIDRLVNDYVSGLKSRAPLEEVSEKARELHRYLIEPLRSKLGGAERLCIVPDKALHFLPFAALMDESGRYLMQTYSLTSAPSASALVQCINERREKSTTSDQKILAVGNPAFDRATFPTLQDLPDAEREAKESADFYGNNKVVLIGAAADKRRLRAELEDCTVAHLALHCMVEANSPSLAALILAPGSGTGPNSEALSGEGLLSLNEIYGMSLPKTNLVVLSACQSGLGRYYRGEGIVSLVRPFLALRVPTVVASLWSVDSQSTASLMIEFHKQMRTASKGPGDALRFSQTRMAESEEHKHPYYWAPFTVIGDSY